MKAFRFIRAALAGGFLIGVTGLLFYLYRFWSYDDPFITYRYAQNLIQGLGFVYNPGERILSTTTPLFALLLGFTGRFWPNLPHLAVLIGSVSISFIGLFLLYTAQRAGHVITGWVAMSLGVVFGLLSITLGSETPLYIALVLSVFYAYITRRYMVVGVLSALLILTRPDGVLLPLVLGLHFLIRVRRPIPWKAIILFGLVSAVGWGFLWVYFGSPVPVTLAAKQHQGLMTISQGFAQGLWTTIAWYRAQWFFIVECGLAIIGLVQLTLKKSAALLLVIWTLVYFASYSILGVTRYFWYYAPLVPGFVLLVGAGVEMIGVWAIRAKASKIMAYALCGLLALGLCFFHLRHIYRQSFILDKRIPLYTEAGEWLRQNTPEQSKVGALEVGAIGYYAQRYMVDFAGLIQPDVARQMTANTTYLDTTIYAIDRFRPEYLVIYESFAVAVEEKFGKTCNEEVRFSGQEFGVEQDLLILHCAY